MDLFFIKTKLKDNFTHLRWSVWKLSYARMTCIDEDIHEQSKAHICQEFDGKKEKNIYWNWNKSSSIREK